MMPITAETSKRFAGYMLTRHDMQMKPKTGNWFMEVVRVLLGYSREVWVRFSTKIGRTIYSDIVPGTGETFADHVREMGLICHECVHDTLSWWDYAMNKTYRAVEECQGYAASMWIYHRFTGGYITVADVLDRLKFYKLEKPQLRVARQVLTKYDSTIRNGGTPNMTIRVALEWFEDNGVESAVKTWLRVGGSREALKGALLK